MNFQDLQNAVIQRLHQAGVNWGNSITATSQNLVTPYWIKLELNQAYARFLSLVKDFPACVQPFPVTFPTMSGEKKWNINPLPSTGSGGISVPNPAALQVYEITYTISGGQERYIPFVSTTVFRRYSAGYTQRQASFSAYPDVLTQMFGRRQIDMFPGTATNGDTVKATICPDPIATQAAFPGVISCANGGIMINDTDVPLLHNQFVQAIVEGAVYSMARALNKPQVAADAKALWDEMVQEAIDYGSTAAEGDAEQRVIDTWITTFDSEISNLAGNW